MKTAISLPDPIYDEAEELASRLGMSRSQLYATAVQELIRSHRSDDVTEALNRVYAEEPSGLDPGIAALQAASIRDEEW